MAEAGKITGVTSGMYSGVDWVNKIIPQLVAIESRQIDLWKAQKADYKLEQDAWRDVNMRFSNLKDKSYGLLQDSTWEKVSVATSDETYLKATDAGGAVAGTYDFRIRQLATASILRSDGRLNDHAATRSKTEVISGSTKTVNLTTTTDTWTQFDNDIDSSGWIRVQTATGDTGQLTLSSYSTIQALMDAVKTQSGNKARMRYDSKTDTFVVESMEAGSSLTLTEGGGANNFFTEVNIDTGTYTDQTGAATGDGIGIDPTATLANANFDEIISTSSGSFKVNGETISWTNSNTLNGIMSAINTSSAGVNAFYDENLDKVILTNKVTGAYNIEVVDVTGNLANVLGINSNAATQNTMGQSAIFTINSKYASDEIGKNSNTFTIGGTTFTLKKTNVTGTGDAAYQAAAPVTVTVAKDISAIKTAINDWVTQWNSAMGYLKTSMHYDDTTKQSGALTGSGTAIGIQQRMYTITTDRYSNLPASMNQLAHIGITLGAYKSGNEGKLVVDDTVLTNALTDRLQDVENLFGMSTTGGSVKDYGVAYKIYDYTDDLTNSTGVIANQIKLYSNPNKTGLMDMIDKQIADYQEYIERYRKSLQAEFEAMEIAIGQMKTQLGYLSAYTAR